MLSWQKLLRNTRLLEPLSTIQICDILTCPHGQHQSSHILKNFVTMLIAGAIRYKYRREVFGSHATILPTRVARGGSRHI